MSEQRKEHKSKIGGQALIEGVMMKGIYHSAMACRLPDGEIDVEVWDEKNGKNMPWYRKTPIIRGSFNFVSSIRFFETMLSSGCHDSSISIVRSILSFSFNRISRI